MIQAVLTDIEGTTTSLSFVHDVLFPFARERIAEFVQAHSEQPEVRQALADVAELAGKPLSEDEAVAQLLQWIDQDRKATPLKALQGMLWEAGYRDGDFVSHVYPDAAEKLREWHAEGLRLYVFSSGSVQAQKLLFGHTPHGDLTPLFSGYFDTTTGAKREAESYRRIAAEIDLPTDSVLFLSDIEAELDAAREAGMATAWLVRNGKPDPAATHRQVRDFHAL